jgi:ABC-type uncharacterized transport system substrate-binding protein
MLQQTHTIPVVFVIVADPVSSGFVKTLGRPGSNTTGVTIMDPTITGKLLQLLKEITPRIRCAAIIFNPRTAPYRDIYLQPFKTAAASLGLEAIVAPIHDQSGFAPVIAAESAMNSGLR